ncbi:MAG: hypothetical protein WAO55_13410 [Candidatus Manganitrophaceae bacterium]
MKTKTVSKTIRRSVALPRDLIERVTRVAPPESAQNLNRLVTVALEEFVARRQQETFEAAMTEMAADPGIQKESVAISKVFSGADADGLKGD